MMLCVRFFNLIIHVSWGFKLKSLNSITQIAATLKVGNIRVIPRFHPTGIGVNLGLTMIFKSLARNAQCYFCILYFYHYTKCETNTDKFLVVGSMSLTTGGSLTIKMSDQK